MTIRTMGYNYHFIIDGKIIYIIQTLTDNYNAKGCKSPPNFATKTIEGDTGVFSNTDKSDGDVYEEDSTSSQEESSISREEMIVPSSQTLPPLQFEANRNGGIEERDDEDSNPGPVQVNEYDGATTFQFQTSMDPSYGLMHHLIDQNRRKSAEKDKTIADLQHRLTLKECELETEKMRLNKLIDEKEKVLEEEITKGDELKRKYIERIKLLEAEKEQRVAEIADCRYVIGKKENEVLDLKKKVEEQDEKVKRAELEKKILHLEKKNEILEMQKKYDGEIAQLKVSLKEAKSDVKLQKKQSIIDQKQSLIDKGVLQYEHLREKGKLDKLTNRLERELEKKKDEEENKHLRLQIKVLEKEVQVTRAISSGSSANNTPDLETQRRIHIEIVETMTTKLNISEQDNQPTISE